MRFSAAVEQGYAHAVMLTHLVIHQRDDADSCGVFVGI